jgi:hypothetical protein
MARSACCYDIYLPLTNNEGVLFPDRHYLAVEERLFARFGGFTSQQRQFPFRGAWKTGSQVFYDQVIVITALDFRRGGSARFIAQLKAEMLPQFEQLEILITETALRVH